MRCGDGCSVAWRTSATGRRTTCAGPPDEVELGGGNGVTRIATTTTQSDSGLLLAGVAARAFGIPTTGALSSWRVWFTGAKKGTYTYVCQIHDGMKGSIVVK